MLTHGVCYSGTRGQKWEDSSVQWIWSCVQRANYQCQYCNSFLEVDFPCKWKAAEKAPTSKPDKMMKKPKPNISYSQFFSASILPGFMLLQDWGLSAALHSGASLLVMPGNNAQIYVVFIAWGFIFLCLSYIRIPCSCTCVHLIEMLFWI